MSPSNIQLSEIPKPTERSCETTREILDRIGDKWSLYIIATLSRGTRRFNELRREIEGISQRMLTLTLRGLERDGLVKRTMFPTVPPRVDYELTELGKTLLEPVMALVAWAEKNKPVIAQSQKHFDETLELPQAEGRGTVYRQR